MFTVRFELSMQIQCGLNLAFKDLVLIVVKGKGKGIPLQARCGPEGG